MIQKFPRDNNNIQPQQQLYANCKQPVILHIYNISWKIDNLGEITLGTSDSYFYEEKAALPLRLVASFLVACVLVRRERERILAHNNNLKDISTQDSIPQLSFSQHCRFLGN